MLRDPSIFKKLDIILCTLSFILIYLSLLEIWKECLMRENKKQQYRICTSLVGRQNTSSLLMFQCLVMVVVFHNILSFMIQIKKNQMVPRPYVGSYLGEKGIKFLHKPWIIALSKSVENFIFVSISDIPTIEYWQNLGTTMDKAKETIPKECRIGDTCFTSFVTIGDNLYTRHSKNLNHVHKYRKISSVSDNNPGNIC